VVLDVGDAVLVGVDGVNEALGQGRRCEAAQREAEEEHVMRVMEASHGFLREEWRPAWRTRGGPRTRLLWEERKPCSKLPLYPSPGLSHFPDLAERNTASMTSIVLTASSSGTGAGFPSRIARDTASPWTVY